ncbi:16S rRNA (guanine(527)-N(7))-methyltransferase RsmG [Qipengyuania sp. MTN3-11]|uniref:16S rRNA (guanine(527)-N(7))-methyltransferase RsmG n=1 Tax=Qipengyuania sp. MTN3-11 TaxID=3056557 RepID=UPI0036F2ADEE
MIDGEMDAKAFVAKFAPASALEKLKTLEEALRAENQLQNLVSSASLRNIWQRHFADSAQLMAFVPRETQSCMDLGSGAGFPGLILAILAPEVAVTLVEVRGRRIEWLERMRNDLGLHNCKVEGCRLEQVSTRPVDLITARAFAPLEKLLKLSARFSTSRTRWLLPKGRSAASEVKGLPDNLRAMFHVEQSLTSADAGIIIGTGKVEARQ